MSTWFNKSNNVLAIKHRMYGKDQSLIETKPECQTLLTEFFVTTLNTISSRQVMRIKKNIN